MVNHIKNSPKRARQLGPGSVAHVLAFAVLPSGTQKPRQQSDVEVHEPVRQNGDQYDELHDQEIGKGDKRYL